MNLQISTPIGTAAVPFHALKRGQIVVTSDLSKRQLQMRVVAANHYYTRRRRQFSGTYVNGLSIIKREA